MKNLLKILFICIPSFLLHFSCSDRENVNNNSNSSNTENSERYKQLSIDSLYKLAAQTTTSSQLSEIYFHIGNYLLNENKNDSAFYYFNQAKEAFLLTNDSSKIGRTLQYLSIIQTDEGDYYGSEETSVSALKYLNKQKDSILICSVYNTLAINADRQKNFEQSIRFYNLALQYSVNKITEIKIKNNQTIQFIRIKEYPNAIPILEKLKNEPILLSHPLLKAKIIDNLAYAKWMNNGTYNPAPEFYKVLKTREEEIDYIGQSVSHSHLSDYYSNTSKNKAILHAEKMYDIATQANIPADRLEALTKLINLAPPVLAKKYSLFYLSLNNSIQTTQNQSKQQFAIIRYEVEKNKEENLKLKAENTQKSYQILKQRVAVFTFLGIIIFISIFFYFWYKKRQEKIKREIELKYSKKIHDEVANGIYHLITQLENQPDIGKKDVLDDLEEVYNKSRNLSHEYEFKMELKNDFSNILKIMLRPYSSENTKIVIVGNNPQIWIKIPTEKKEELFYTLQEIMTNMKKHSGADFVTLKFERDNQNVIIKYSDNGIGLSSEDLNSSRGIQNIKNRMKSIQGTLIFNDTSRGCLITIII